MPPEEDTGYLLKAVNEGEDWAKDSLYAKFYQELRSIAQRALRNERRGHTLQPSDLVNEAYLRLSRLTEVRWESREHFLGFAATAMRRVLCEYARKRNSKRRGGKHPRITLSAIDSEKRDRSYDASDFYWALDKLDSLNSRQAEVVILRNLIGASVDEVASTLNISPRTVKSDTRFALAWLNRELDRQ